MTKVGSVIIVELGICVLDEEGKSVFSKRFSNPVEAFSLLRANRLPNEINTIENELKHFERIVVNDDNLHSILGNLGLAADMMPAEKQQEIRKNIASFAVECGLSADEGTAIQELRDFAIAVSSSRVKEASGKLDLHVTQAINALDELDKTINVLAARMREWYGLHFPELDHLVQSLTAYARIVSSAGTRYRITNQILQDAGIQEKKSEIILGGVNRSRGGDITDDNLKMLRQLADQVIEQSELRDDLANNIETTMDVIAPNVKELLTASVGARVIAKAGSLQRLATLPASTIQILGAEKALFRSLKTGANPPKHGMLFQHPLIHAAPKWQRGKIARAVAAKVAIAARIDAYRHAEKDPIIADKLKKRIIEIQEKNKLPPSEDERFKKSQEHKGRQRDFGARGGRRKDRPWKHGPRQFDRQHRRSQGYQQFRFQGIRGQGDEEGHRQESPSQREQQQYHQPSRDWKGDRPSQKNKKYNKKKFRKRF
ncbi:MAG: putative pre-mRNA processing ribonucleoprotein snoRNA-binding domain protein [Nitrososphaeraceae archaeon]|nr:putative pre-mRNA processing ribonucleoprotein snoRNA-binding domain protein [Nitrososphaeraceae archaeon]